MSARRNEIVTIAGALFAERGYVSTTVREIGERAGILSGSLYHHFDSKEAIAEQILLAYYLQMLEDFRVILASDDDEAKMLAALIKTAYQGIADRPHAVALIANSGGQLLGLDRFQQINEINNELEQIWIKVIKGGQRKNVFSTAIEPRLLFTFIRDAMWVTIRWWRPGGRLSIQDVADRYVQMIYGGILLPAA